MSEPSPSLRVPKISRRTVLSVLAVGAASAVALGAVEVFDEDVAYPVRPEARTGNNPLVAENRLPGSSNWRIGVDGTVAAEDRERRIQGYASVVSPAVGESVDFHVTVANGGDFTIAVYRLGHYGGEGARLMVESPVLHGEEHGLPEVGATGLIACDWPGAWTLDIPPEWRSGIYLAVFTSVSGHRAYTPFVVREPARGSDLLVIVPVTTYQAYNQWPLDGATGKNLYKGYQPSGAVGGLPERAFQVSFDRPYARGGLPNWFNLDASFARWAEENAYDVTYATSVDLHEGRVDPEQYTSLVFSGHDEYWSKAMRDTVEDGLAAGTHLAFLAANSIYFHIRLSDSADGRPSRIVTCYKEKGLDPAPDESGPTMRWRKLKKHGKAAEQRLLGVQYNGILAKPVPLVVQRSRHWFWAGTGLRDGDAIADLVAVEADGVDPKMPSPKGKQTLLSASPYPDRRNEGASTMQNTSIVVDRRRSIVFVAGTFNWPLFLGDPEHRNEHVHTATTNLLTRMLSPRE